MSVVLMIITSSLVSMICCHQHDGVQLINQLNEFFHFDHHIIITDSATDLSGWFPSKNYNNGTLVNFVPLTVYTFVGRSKPKASNVKRANLKKKISKNPFLIVVVDRLNFVGIANFN